MWDRSKVELHIPSQVCNAGAASNAFRELQILWDKVTVMAEQLCPVEGNGSGLSAIQCTSPNVMDPYELVLAINSQPDGPSNGNLKTWCLVHPQPVTPPASICLLLVVQPSSYKLSAGAAWPSSCFWSCLVSLGLLLSYTIQAVPSSVTALTS